MSICISNIGGGVGITLAYIWVLRGGLLNTFGLGDGGRGVGYVLRGVWGYSKYIYMREGAERGAIGGETKRP